MFERITMVFKAMINALVGKVQDPQMMLESTYGELQADLIAARKELAQAVATEAQLKERIKTLAAKEGADSQVLRELKERLERHQANLAQLRRRLEDLEAEVQKAYTKKQVLIARDKSSRAILVAKAITEEGATFDREITSDSPDSPKDFLIWIFVTIALLVVIIIVLRFQI